MVALRKESVDRNPGQNLVNSVRGMVALRKESVDRNARCRCWVLSDIGVALRKESVDRNTNGGPIMQLYIWSLSARRAWIEMAEL